MDETGVKQPESERIAGEIQATLSDIDVTAAELVSALLDRLFPGRAKVKAERIAVLRKSILTIVRRHPWLSWVTAAGYPVFFGRGPECAGFHAVHGIDAVAGCVPKGHVFCD